MAITAIDTGSNELEIPIHRIFDWIVDAFEVLTQSEEVDAVAILGLGYLPTDVISGFLKPDAGEAAK